MSASTVRLERLAFLLILVGFGTVFKVVVGIRAAHSAANRLVAIGRCRLLSASP
jgi:hypothetical protein